MNTNIKNKLVFALALTLLLGGLFAGGAVAADGVQLDQFHASQGVACADCHGADNQREAVPMIKCLECHDTKAVAAATADLQPTNPHDNRHFSTETDCNYCHHQHQKSENFCTPCHLRFEFVVP
ncbi:MAG: flavodoxin [Desulfuromonas sp.]|nr:MAG: flavodoxin [Desulfuromonas sp.]